VILELGNRRFEVGFERLFDVFSDVDFGTFLRKPPRGVDCCRLRDFAFGLGYLFLRAFAFRLGYLLLCDFAFGLD
jgi:hypothetical protein